ncbi:MAG: DUF1573 domain-containing protein [Candidatus Caldatribacteriota bacterium]|nr:DUF1573 domain-containing protein [Atribacterota bacterium]MDD3031547.1 DUF1573 domain-containing protein [Atribacterota bacterium]MDD3641585.1 DUF1573 domain-containing protein [Atribacterota bacterium]MDD4764849.1 DUF1573 domain-containing protein [Atribacterota bacterium]
MKQRKIRICTIIIVILLILFLLNGCSKPEPPKLTLSEDSWHYGEVTPDQRPAHDFVLKNEGGGKIIIDSVYSSCPCVILDLTEKEIPPGEEVLLKTIFDPTGYEGEVSKIVTIKSNDPENPEKRIEATITVLRVPNPDIELSEQTFDLGSISLGEIQKIQFTISNTGDADLIIEEIVSEDIFTNNLPIPLTIPLEEQFEAEVYMETNQLKEGEFRKAIRIMTNDPQNARIFIRIMGNIE